MLRTEDALGLLPMLSLFDIHPLHFDIIDLNEARYNQYYVRVPREYM